MKERPILLNREMIRAILEGRKTQARRVAKNVVFDSKFRSGWKAVQKHTEIAVDAPAGLLGEVCPYGQPGDRLWVRETHHVPGGYLEAELINEIRNGVSSPESLGVTYRADAPSLKPCDGGWTPSIRMPRWASRITLEITGVRVEQLQDMEGQHADESDAIAEGINAIHHGDGAYYYSASRSEPHPHNWCDPTDAFRELWRSINGPGSWDVNPWVWVIEFKQVTP